jgi:hypothetical protein
MRSCPRLFSPKESALHLPNAGGGRDLRSAHGPSSIISRGEGAGRAAGAVPCPGPLEPNLRVPQRRLTAPPREQPLRACPLTPAASMPSTRKPQQPTMAAGAWRRRESNPGAYFVCWYHTITYGLCATVCANFRFGRRQPERASTPGGGS